MGMVHEGNSHVDYEEALRILSKRDDDLSQLLHTYVDDCANCKKRVKKAALEVKRLDKRHKREDRGKLLAFIGFALVIIGLAGDSLTSQMGIGCIVAIVGIVVTIAGYITMPKEETIKT